MAQPPAPNPVSQQMEEIVRRLRLLEERYTGLRKKAQFTEQNMLKDAKEIMQEIDVLNETMADLRSDMGQMAEKMQKLEEEVTKAVRKNEFHVLAKYIEFWEPMQFLTRDEAEDLIREFKHGNY